MTAPHTQCQPDIVERLRFAAQWSETEIDIAPPELLKQAADRIEELSKALRGLMPEDWQADDCDCADCDKYNVAARALATSLEQEKTNA